MPQGRIDCLRILLGLPLFLINADQLLPTPGVLAKTIVGDPIEPGRKPCFAAKAADVLVGAQKSLLSQIIGQFQIGSGKLSKQTAHSRLMTPDQLAKRVLVVINKNACNEVCIS